MGSDLPPEEPLCLALVRTANPGAEEAKANLMLMHSNVQEAVAGALPGSTGNG
jgi:hypothetical protein